MIFKNGDKIVFAGDSVTDMGSVNPVGYGPGDCLGQGYPRMIENLMNTFYPEISLNVINSGISGNTSRDLLERYDRDVVSMKPDWVSICIGINDVWRQFDQPLRTERHVLPEEYESNMEKMISAVKDKVKGIFILTPYYMMPEYGDAMRTRMDEYGKICKKLADRHGCIFVDFQKMYDEFFKIYHPVYIAWDRIHPNEIGSTLMAKTFLEVCSFGK